MHASGANNMRAYKVYNPCAHEVVIFAIGAFEGVGGHRARDVFPDAHDTWLKIMRVINGL